MFTTSSRSLTPPDSEDQYVEMSVMPQEQQDGIISQDVADNLLDFEDFGPPRPHSVPTSQLGLDESAEMMLSNLRAIYSSHPPCRHLRHELTRLLCGNRFHQFLVLLYLIYPTRRNSFLPTPSHLTTPPKLKPSGSKAASGSKANKPAAKKWSHAPFGRSDSKATSNEESLSDRESGGTSVLAKTTETISKPVKKAPAEQPKPKKSSITQRVVRKRLPPSPEVDEGLGDEEDQLDEMDYDIPLEPLGPVPEEPDVDASGEDGLRDGSEIPVPFTGSLRHGSEGQEEEVADSEQQDSPSDPEADVEAEVDAREDEGVRLDRTSFKAKDDIREVSPVVDMADDGPGDKAGKGRSPTPVASAAPTAVPAKSVPSRQPSDSGSSRSKPAPKATTNAVAGPSRVGPASENATESATLKIGPPKKVYSGSNGFPRDKPKRDLPKTITPITPPPRTNTDKSRPRTPKLSPNALKQLAEFDAFMAPLFPEPAPAVTLPAPVNGANVTDNHGHPPSPVSPSSPQNNLNARDNDTPPRPHSPSQAGSKIHQRLTMTLIPIPMEFSNPNHSHLN
ncbi:hypothetical protein D9758_016663, partial [Tetrapyrgos nigripes]